MSANAPIIIKRKKIIAGGGHHGGAWKVAYADFVTAMMAFFMLMWLLNATTEQQRKGIADYFSPTVPINRISGGGDGVSDGFSLDRDAGLGLTIVRTFIVHDLGGTISIGPAQVTAPRGTAVEIRVPRRVETLPLG